MKKCNLCGCALIEKNKVPYGKTGAGHHISRHHYFPQRLKKYFDDSEVKRLFKIEDKDATIMLCYECHEEMLHNIILSTKTIEKLRKRMMGKPIKKRIEILFKQLLK